MKQHSTLPSPLEGSKSNLTAVAEGLGQTLLSQRGSWYYAQVSRLIPATAGRGLVQLFACLRACSIQPIFVPLLVPCKIHTHSAAGLGRREKGGESSLQPRRLGTSPLTSPSRDEVESIALASPAPLQNAILPPTSNPLWAAVSSVCI